MKRKAILLTIIFLTVTFCLRGENKQQSLVHNALTDSIYNYSLCDSIISTEFVNYMDNKNDTLINRIKYVYYLKLSNNYILAFREYSKKYRMLQGIDIIKDGVATVEVTKFVEDKENHTYFSDILLSPDDKYVHIGCYYETLDINDDTQVIIKFGSGYILDIEKGAFVKNLTWEDVGGNWTYCNQYIVDGKILFNPTHKNVIPKD